MAKTNNITEKEIKKYFSKIRRALVCDFKTKSKILKDLRNEVEEYLERNPDSSLENIIDHFGTPDAIAEEFAISAGTDYIKKYKVHKTIKLIVIIVLLLTLVFASIASIVIIRNRKRSAIYYYEETIEDFGIIETE